MNGIDFDEDEIAPTSLSYDGTLSLTFHVEEIQSMNIALSGTMVDICPDLEVEQVIEFGSLYLQQSKHMPLRVKNPARRPLQWKIVVDSSYEDIFSIIGPSSVNYVYPTPKVLITEP